MKFLTEEAKIKMHKSIKYDKAVEYFRGLDFHQAVLTNKDKILSLLPSFTADKSITQLSTIQDTINLG